MYRRVRYLGGGYKGAATVPCGELGEYRAGVPFPRESKPPFYIKSTWRVQNGEANTLRVQLGVCKGTDQSTMIEQLPRVRGGVGTWKTRSRGKINRATQPPMTPHVTHWREGGSTYPGATRGPGHDRGGRRTPLGTAHPRSSP